MVYAELQLLFWESGNLIYDWYLHEQPPIKPPRCWVCNGLPRAETSCTRCSIFVVGGECALSDSSWEKEILMCMGSSRFCLCLFPHDLAIYPTISLKSILATCTTIRHVPRVLLVNLWLSGGLGDGGHSHFPQAVYLHRI